jgi:hypothetical protein
MHASREQITDNVATIQERIAAAAVRSGRDPGDVLLVAAAKTVPAEAVGWAVEAGVGAVGENYVQELRAKHDLVRGVRWHYIGTLQSSTAHHVADLVDVVETVAGGRALERLAGRAARSGRSLDVLLEVDFTGERSGVRPEELAALADAVISTRGLRLRGLMTLPPLPEVAEDSRPWFIRLRELRDGLRENRPEVLDLSMGMSLDYEVAVEEGATMVRVGTALFGPRAV